MELKAKTFRAEDAKQLLDNPVWKTIWGAVNEHLDSKALLCNTAKEPEVAADLVRCKQLVKALEREVHRVIQDGQIAEIQIEELNKKKTPLQRMFLR